MTKILILITAAALLLGCKTAEPTIVVSVKEHLDGTRDCRTNKSFFTDIKRCTYSVGDTIVALPSSWTCEGVAGE